MIKLFAYSRTGSFPDSKYIIVKVARVITGRLAKNAAISPFE